jgi:hypothetical protein
MLKIYLEFREQILDVGLYKLWYYQLSQIYFFASEIKENICPSIYRCVY